MLRLISFIALLTLISFGAAWISDNEGTVTFEWLGYHIQTSIMMLFSGLLLLILAIVLAIELFLFIINIPKRLKIRAKINKQEKVLHTLTQGFSALLTHDNKTANISAKKALQLLGNEENGKPLANLLAAQVANLDGDEEQANKHYNNLLEHPETELAGIKGLLTADEKHNDINHAIELAKKAMKLQPDNAETITHLLALYKKSKQWAEIQLFLENFGNRKWTKILGKTLNLNHEKSLAIFMRAKQHVDDKNNESAFDLAHEAHKLNPSFIPAALLAGELAMNQGKKRITTAICQTTWKLAPHPEIAELYFSIYDDSKPKQAIKRAKKLASFNPNHIESNYIIAKTSLICEDLNNARNYTKLALGKNQTSRLCLLMSDIEESDSESKPNISENWKEKAKYVSDFIWFCDDCGFIMGDKWQIECNHCHATNSTSWGLSNIENNEGKEPVDNEANLLLDKT